MSQRAKLIIGAAIPLCIGVLYLLFPETFRFLVNLMISIFREPERFREMVTEMGVGGYAFIVFIQILQVVVFPLPGQASTIIAGLFGTSWGVVLGILLTLIGLTVGAVFAFLIARYFLRDWVTKRLSEKEGWRAFTKLSSGRGLWVIGLIYVIPGLPNDFMCYVLGLSNARFSSFILVSTVCRIPNVILTFFFGYSLGFQRWWLVGVIATVVIITSIIVYLYRERIMYRIQSKFDESNKQ